MIIKCVVTCRDANGTPTFLPVCVQCREEAYNEGDHYLAAQAEARNKRYESPGLVYDEKDGPAWLFEQFNWKLASAVIWPG